MKKERRWFGRSLMTLTLIFFYLPIVFMVVFSFNKSKSLTHFTGFSMRWYQTMLKSHGMMSSLYITIIANANACSRPPFPTTSIFMFDLLYLVFILS